MGTLIQSRVWGNDFYVFTLEFPEKSRLELKWGNNGSELT